MKPVSGGPELAGGQEREAVESVASYVLGRGVRNPPGCAAPVHDERMAAGVRAALSDDPGVASCNCRDRVEVIFDLWRPEGDRHGVVLPAVPANDLLDVCAGIVSVEGPDGTPWRRVDSWGGDAGGVVEVASVSFPSSPWTRGS